ncbi:GDSL family lipase [Paenibacillus selenitireducens]|uniref:GDSL family lipase n=1 Tax=Paenibacillus selenitireducens TaxID=1324314 RepID=A0A1T2XDM0_9BACL|nr:SGNH/GDSL hydrolase family protein [Paenibacillus selenitireducens]OPA77703.1 GDSL family lipase [Paenibacillus selenitireducens]
MTFIQANDVVLFQGDSITDCGRNYEQHDNLGNGYPVMVAKAFNALYPELNVTFFNRGISGNRVVNLQGRWKQDCLDLKPTWVSILIGINDVWRRYDANDATSLAAFQEGYRDILQQIQDQLQSKLILIEPFVLPVPADRKNWREDLDPKIQVVRELAAEFSALYIPTDGLFAQASMIQPPAHWAEDGVHPSVAGHRLIAEAWLKTVQVI